MPQILLILAGAFLPLVSATAAGSLICARTPLPYSIRFVTGAAAYSLSVFLVLACHAGYLPVYGVWSVVLIAAGWQRAQSTRPLDALRWSYRLLLAGYAAMYLIVALAPEIQEDAAGYHLRIVSDYVRLHAFSGRISFYDALPHGLEMLFVPAFAIGAHSAAKLVHFAFLIALIPLVRETARELRMSDRAGTAAAALLFMAPVCGVAGTSAYTDMGLVCGCCALLYLLVRWNRQRTASLLLCAGLNAGFCFAIKPSFGWVVLAATVFVAVQSLPAALQFAASSAIGIIPWLGRAWLLTGNPFAPFLDAWFPNAASTPAIEHRLFESYNAFRPGFSWWRALPAYTVTGGNQGLLGPAFLLLPLGLLVLYRGKGRRLIACSLILGVPFLANTGTRFLLPALIPATLALTSMVPAAALLPLVAIQAVGAAPPVLDLYEKEGEWRIRDVPLKAALRIVPEDDYLRQNLQRYVLGRMIVRNTPLNARVFVCASLPESYVPRQMLFFWQSTLASRVTDALNFALVSRGSSAKLLSLRTEAGRFASLRITARGNLTFADSPASRWQSLAEGQSLIVPMKRTASGVDLLLWPGYVRPKLEAAAQSGAWERVDPSIDRTQCCIDIRRDATAWMRRAGYRYLLISVAGDAFAEIGLDMARHPDAWGVETIDRSGNFWLFHIRSYTA
ncbi:MAG: glycosyltransferase family 39 protein [Terriglobia bacterium]